MRALYGKDVDPSRVVAYCFYHKRFVTKEQLKKKGCLGKGCNALKKIDNPYWEAREEWKQIKKELQKKRKEKLGRRTR